MDQESRQLKEEKRKTIKAAIKTTGVPKKAMSRQKEKRSREKKQIGGRTMSAKELSHAMEMVANAGLARLVTSPYGDCNQARRG